MPESENENEQNLAGAPEQPMVSSSLLRKYCPVKKIFFSQQT